MPDALASASPVIDNQAASARKAKSCGKTNRHQLEMAQQRLVAILTVR